MLDFEWVSLLGSAPPPGAHPKEVRKGIPNSDGTAFLGQSFCVLGCCPGVAAPTSRHHHGGVRRGALGAAMDVGCGDPAGNVEAGIAC